MNTQTSFIDRIDREVLKGIWLSPARTRSLRWRVGIKKRLWSMTITLAERTKRVIDVVGALSAIIVLAPLFATVAAAIWVEDRGPIFFSQVRVGTRGRPFRMHKFRSMCINAEAKKAQLVEANESASGVIFKMKRDPRITKVGQVIRRLSIDEFPQFFNVLKGEMSLVGPRPALPSEVAQYTQAQRARLQATPGLTCFWQIGGRSDIDFHGQVRLDVDYIASRTIWLDLLILLKTVPAVVFGKGAY